MVNKYPNYHFVNMDALTYAGNMENLLILKVSLIIPFSKVILGIWLGKYGTFDTILFWQQKVMLIEVLKILVFAETNVMGT